MLGDLNSAQSGVPDPGRMTYPPSSLIPIPAQAGARHAALATCSAGVTSVPGTNPADLELVRRGVSRLVDEDRVGAGDVEHRRQAEAAIDDR